VLAGLRANIVIVDPNLAVPYGLALGLNVGPLPRPQAFTEIKARAHFINSIDGLILIIVHVSGGDCRRQPA
jgi:hypothetical protein